MNKALPLAITVASVLMTAAGADKQVMLIASKPSHPPGQHEHNADVLLLAKWLSGTPGLQATTALNGEWPADTAFEKADAVFIYCDGSDGHLAFQDDRAKTISQAVARGAGLMFYHYATEPPAKRGHQEMLDWIGGYFDLNYSVNPIFDASFNALPNHPITRGVKPFHIRDEWYYNLRFRDNTRGLTPILITTPPADSVKADGIRSGNPDVRSKIGQPQIVMWATERLDGGRSVGFTGGHYHSNLADENFRKLVLNSLTWIAKAVVPERGVQVALTEEELTQNLDVKPPK